MIEFIHYLSDFQFACIVIGGVLAFSIISTQIRKRKK
ncbi:hypothetical protein LCGC14_1843500 [marine sediment metagenome]|uniref:Uncharacterized protein n=1 Tax=marine sediment metagenome TaxID=412755 RepID=A0A0F9GCH0_9ZZZZ